MNYKNHREESGMSFVCSFHLSSLCVSSDTSRFTSSTFTSRFTFSSWNHHRTFSMCECLQELLKTKGSSLFKYIFCCGILCVCMGGASDSTRRRSVNWSMFLHSFIWWSFLLQYLSGICVRCIHFFTTRMCMSWGSFYCLFSYLEGTSRWRKFSQQK